MFFDVFSGFLGALKTTFQNIYFESSYILDFPKNTRKQIYQYSDVNGEIHRFVYKNETTESIA